MEVPVVATIERAPQGPINQIVVPVIATHCQPHSMSAHVTWAAPFAVPFVPVSYAGNQMVGYSAWDHAQKFVYADAAWSHNTKTAEVPWRETMDGKTTAAWGHAQHFVYADAAWSHNTKTAEVPWRETSDGKATADVCPLDGLHQQSHSSSEDVSVVLSGLPKMLCSNACLKVAIEQAQVEDDVRTFNVKGGSAEAVVILKTEVAAQKLMRHFRALRCGKSSKRITTRYCAEAGRQLLLSQQRDIFQMNGHKTLEESTLAGQYQTKVEAFGATTAFDGKTPLDPKQAEANSNLHDKPYPETLAELEETRPFPSLVLTKPFPRKRWSSFDEDDEDCETISPPTPNQVLELCDDWESGSLDEFEDSASKHSTEFQ